MRKLSLLFTLLALSFSAFSQEPLKVRSAAPQFEALSMAGKTFDLSQNSNNVVLMTFWSTRCAICHEEIPKMNLLAAKFQGQNVVFLGFTNENEARVNPYLAKNPFKFDIIPNSFGTLLAYADKDKNGNINMPYPSYYLIDQQGKVALRASGFDKTPQISAEIARLLNNSSK
jgi:peroxiredoxin